MITIHVGLHKTGSSSIQMALRLASRRGGLQVFTPVPGRLLETADFAVRLRERSRSRHVVLSDEGLLGDPGNAYAEASARIRVLNTVLGDLKHEIVLYLRPQTSWLSSVYLQLVQQGQPLHVREFWEGIRDQPNLRWASLVELLNNDSAAERVAVRAFIPGRDVVVDFFDCADLSKPPRPVAGGIRENVSIAAVQAPILVALNKNSDLSALERLRLRHLFQNRLAAGATSGLSPFPEDLQREISDRFRDDWADIADILSMSDREETRVFRETLGLWDASPRGFAGEALGDSRVEAELLRTLRVVANEIAQQRSNGIPSRIAAKIRSNPRDIPAAVGRALRRQARP